jgi:LacI family transcriptional regulator
MPTSERQDHLEAELRTGIPVVFVDLAPRNVEADSVTIDNERGAFMATSHLLEQGHRRIAVIADRPAIPTARERIAGFTSAHSEAGVRLDPRLIKPGVRSIEEVVAVLGELLDGDDPPTAVFAARNILAAGAVRTLRERGLQRRVALVGFDDFPLADLLDPPLTVIRQDVPRIGRAVGEVLFTRIDGDTSPPRHLVLPPSLVVRGSGEIPPHRP